MLTEKYTRKFDSMMKFDNQDFEVQTIARSLEGLNTKIY